MFRAGIRSTPPSAPSCRGRAAGPRRRRPGGAPRRLDRARAADLPRPVPDQGRAGRLRPALRRPGVPGVADLQPRHATATSTATPPTTSSSRCGATRAGTTTAPTCRCRPRARCSAPRSCPSRGRGHRLGRHAGRLRGARRRRRSDRSPACRAYHSLYYSQGRAGYLPSKQNDDGGYAGYGYHDGEAPLRPLVKVHPDTGRPNLLIGRHAYGIVGMDPDESERLLDELND